MEATLKRRMWKLALLHFSITAISFFAGLVLLLKYKDEDNYLVNVLYPSLSSFLYFLQPLCLLIDWCMIQVSPSFGRNHSALITFLSFPIWSICFGWIFIRGKDWLNHFPVLGRKVF